MKEFYFVRSQVAEQPNKTACICKNERTNKGLLKHKEPTSTRQERFFFCDEAAAGVLVVGQTRTAG
jgi:hypothetical protein